MRNLIYRLFNPAKYNLEKALKYARIYNTTNPQQGFRSILEAIEHVHESTETEPKVIQILSGTYNEKIDLKPNVHIQGDAP